MYELLKRDGLAKRGRFTTVHGVVETPVFMNVGTAAAIKGAVSTDDLREIKTQVELSNTYHLHVRPGDEIIKKLGGLHKFMPVTHWTFLIACLAISGIWPFSGFSLKTKF